MTQIDYKNLLDTIRNMIQEQAYSDMERLIEELHPADLADLVEHLESDEMLGREKGLARS